MRSGLHAQRSAIRLPVTCVLSGRMIDGAERSSAAAAVRTGVDHDQQFHESIVDVAGCCGLDDKDILVSYGLSDSNACFLIRVVQAHSLRDLYSQPAAHQPMVRRDMTPATRLLSYPGKGVGMIESECKRQEGD
jgi:hypothetical protein